MRIIHFVDLLDPAMGGPPISVASLAAAQAELGYQITLIANESPGREQQITESLQCVPGIERVKIIFLAQGNIFHRTTGISAEKFINKFIGPTDVIHIHGMWRPLLRAACRAAMRKGAGYVLCPRGMLHPWALRQKQYKKLLAMWLGWRSVIRNAAFIHALNVEEAGHVQALGLNNRTRLLPNGIFADEFDDLPDPELFIQKHPALSGRSYILFLGRLHYVKGLDYLLSAFKIFSEIRQEIDLVIAGPDGGWRDNMLKYIDNLQLSGRVHLVGALYGSEKYAAMLGACCFCQPSRQEGFSMAATEAMACGLPVILSDQCNFSEVVEAGAGKVVALDADSLSKAMLDVLESEPRRQAMGSAARELVFSRYTWPKIAESSLEVYKAISKSQ